MLSLHSKIIKEIKIREINANSFLNFNVKFANKKGAFGVTIALSLSAISWLNIRFIGERRGRNWGQIWTSKKYNINNESFPKNNDTIPPPPKKKHEGVISPWRRSTESDADFLSSTEYCIDKLFLLTCQLSW